jgi:hypothetical protein
MTSEPTAEPVAHRRHARRTGGGIPQLPFRRLTNPFTPLEVLSAVAPPLDKAAGEAIGAFVTRRKREIGDRGP